MCGIAGIINQTASTPVGNEELESMIRTMRHRGPDAFGLRVFNRRAGFAHARLAIIDLCDQSNQPFVSDDGRYWITYNGEIFNYIELKLELKALGYTFRTDSDTEVVVNAYRCWGEDSPTHLNGMWAFAIYDTRNHSVFCSRDRFGIKPFYYSNINGRFVFASEPKALSALEPGISSPNWRAIYRLLRNREAASHPDHFLQGVHRLEPAHNLLVSETSQVLSRYWDYPVGSPDAPSLESSAEQFRSLLTDALRIRMRSDVAVGSTLSGGLDSSTLACFLRTFHTGQHKALTAVFPGAPFDEGAQAEQLAKDLNFDWIPIRTSEDDFLDLLQKVILHMDGPTCHPATLPLYQIMSQMRNHVVVAIEGQGSDELLAGYYEQYLPYAIADQLRSGHLVGAWKTFRAGARSRGFPLVAKWALRCSLPSRAHALYRRLQQEDRIYIGPLRQGSQGERSQKNRDQRSYLNSALIRSHSGSLRELLHYGDAMSMAHSIESRMPFMDYRLVELACQLPSTYKLHGDLGKIILRQSGKGIVPERLRTDHSKLGFVTPISRWFRTSPAKTLYPVLHSQTCRERGIFDPTIVDTIIEAHVCGRVDHSTLLFKLLATEMWLQSIETR